MSLTPNHQGWAGPPSVSKAPLHSLFWGKLINGVLFKSHAMLLSFSVSFWFLLFSYVLSVLENKVFLVQDDPEVL